ncbi:MAG TPA: TonB family protein [Polyangia bacterium]
MSRTSSGVPGWVWGWAAATSMVIHGFVLAAIGAGARGAAPSVDVDAALRIGVPPEAAALIDLAALDDEALPPAASPMPPPTLPAKEDERGAFPADEARRAPISALPPKAGWRAPQERPAADRGDGAGRRLEDLAWRRDSSTLHERLTDGAERYQPAHTRTSMRPDPTSPESLRREPVVGPGDSPRTRLARGVASPSAPPSMEVEETTEVDGASPPPSLAPVPAPESTLVATAPGAEAPRSEGPVDAERGPRAFDVRPGPVPRDDERRRTASAELHPSITDLTLASASGADVRGRGPGDAPGAVPRPTTGAAPTQVGQGGPPDAAGEAARTRERMYERYHLEIRARVDAVLGRVWPRALAVRLEQGETMVSFVVRADGRLDGPVRVTKSAGFEEFDRAAVEAIRLVSPFPPIPRVAGAEHPPPAMAISMRVTFSNPVIR